MLRIISKQRGRFMRWLTNIAKYVLIGAAFIAWADNDYKLGLSMIGGTVVTSGVMIIHVGCAFFGGNASDIIARIDR